MTQDGHPREDAIITHFKLPRIALLPAPEHLRLVRSKGGISISFRPVRVRRATDLRWSWGTVAASI